MNNKSRLQKARYLQNLVRDRIIKMFPTLTKEDIKCPGANENGADIKLLTLIARKLFPYNVECKNREEYRTIYKHNDDDNVAIRHTASYYCITIRTDHI